MDTIFRFREKYFSLNFRTGDANFAHVPQVGNLNEFAVNQLYNEVWLSNRNSELTGVPRFLNVEFTKPIELQVNDDGNVNSIRLR